VRPPGTVQCHRDRYDEFVLENRDPSGDEARPTTSRASSPLEAAVIQVLRRQGAPMTSPAIESALQQELGQAIGYTTLISTLISLTEQGAIHRHQDDEGFRYEALPQPRVDADTDAGSDPQILDRLHRFLRDEV
jgi:predicted transcriptional regulator